MKHIVFSSNDKLEISKALKEYKSNKYKSSLLQIFSYQTDKKKLKKIIKKFVKKFPNAVIIGATTAGEIINAKMYDNTTVLSLSLFKSTSIKARYIKNIDKPSGVKLSSKICSKHTKASIILSQGLNGDDYDGFIKGFKENNSSIIVAGGLAGDNFKLKRTYVFLNNNIYDKGSVAVSFSSKKLYADNRYNLNWTPIGKEFTITKSNGNVVHTIDNQSSVKIFKKYLGKQIFDSNALPDFQLLYKEGLTTVARTPMARDGDSLIFAAPLKEGQKVQFGFSNAPSVISGSKLIKNIINKNPADAIYIFSCIARKTLLGNSLENEFKHFQDIAPSAGFFTYGEYYSTSVNNAILNCTTTILILSESKKSKKKVFVKDKLIHNLDDVTFNALTHFVEQTSQELNANVKLLNQYKNAVDVSLLVSKTDNNGVITYVNDNFCKVSGYDREELIGKNHNIVRDSRVSNFIFKKMWMTIKKGKIWKGQFPNRTKNNKVYYVSATIMPTYNESNKIDGYIAIRQDITKQVIARNRIKEKEKFIKAIFDNQENIVVLSSKEKGMISTNKTLYEYFDYSNFDDFKDKHNCICDLFLVEDGYIHPDKNKNWLDDISQNNKIDYKAKMLSKKNKIHIFDVKVNKINDEYIINLSDITNLENALQQAYLSEKAKSTFLANMSHEIRTPLNGILGFTDLLMNKKLDKENKKYIDIIHNSGESLLNIVNDILDFSKIENGELSLYETDSDLFTEMESVVSTFASMAKSKKIDYYIYIDTNIPKKLNCDVQRIKQVLSNLISNAIKFTPENGSVGVRILLKEVKKKTVTIEFNIKDTGIGISKDKTESIFDAFSQADNSISREFGGTGLGLSISSKYIKMMNDKLRVISREGEGSEFYFQLKLPIVDATFSVEKSFDIKDKSIVILEPNEYTTCKANEIVQIYLDTWKCDYKIITSLELLDENTELLIICSKLFDENACKNALKIFENLNLIYIEGGDEKFECTHDRFHLLTQPMTGSSLFNMFMTLSYNDELAEVQIIKAQEQFNGNILVAEDNITNQMLIEIMLEERGLKYLIIDNGQKAIDEALKKDYDLILMDINMPVLDGVSATKQLRENGYKKPIVSLSANVIKSDIQSYKEAGMDDSLAKPIDTQELNNVLRKYVTNEITEEFIDFDIVDIEALAKAISIQNTDIIKKLLISFSKSAEDIVNNLKDNNLDDKILHNIKGISGNLRFNKLFELSKKLENEVSGWDELNHQKNKKLIISHLDNIITNIKLLG